MRTLPALVILLAVLGSGLAARADDDAKGKPDLRRTPEEILAERHEALRKELLAAYRKQTGFHVTYRCVRDHPVGEEQTAQRGMLSILADGATTVGHYNSTDDDGKPRDMGWLISPERFVINTGHREDLVVTHGTRFPQRRSDRVNGEIERLNKAHATKIATLEPLGRALRLGMARGADGKVEVDCAFAMKTQGAETPSWLEESGWKPLVLQDANEEYAKLSGGGLTRYIDRRTGMLLRDRMLSEDGKLVSWIRRAENVYAPADWRKQAKEYGAQPLNAQGKRFAAGMRLLGLRLVIHNVIAAEVRTDAPPAWLREEAEALVAAVFDDALLEEELDQLVAWGKTQIDAAAVGGAAKDSGKIERGVLLDMQARLFDRWWEPIEKALPVEKQEDPTDLRLPPKASPLAGAFREAVRTCARQRTARAWTD